MVVDGAPNANTVLSLTQRPGFPTPDRLAADLSAQMVFRYLDDGAGRHEPARVVTDNHFDQDGLVGVFALVDPEAALAQRTLLEDVAAAAHWSAEPVDTLTPRLRLEEGDESSLDPAGFLALVVAHLEETARAAFHPYQPGVRRS